MQPSRLRLDLGTGVLQPAYRLLPGGRDSQGGRVGVHLWVRLYASRMPHAGELSKEAVAWATA